MNVDTGELRRIAINPKGTEQEKIDDFRKQMEALAREGFEQVPSELEPAAIKKLAGADKAMVSLTSGGELSKWATVKRKEKRKAAKQSKKRNRK